MTLKTERSRLRRAFSPARSAFIALALAGVVASSVPTQAQTNDEIESIRDERKQVQADKVEQAGKVDAASAELDELIEALQIMQAEVTGQESRLAEAESQLAQRQQESAIAYEEIEAKALEVVELEEKLSQRAIDSFVSRDEANASPLIEASDPNKAARMQSVVEDATRSDVEIGEELARVQEDLEINRALAADAEAEAIELEDQIAVQLVDLEVARDAQAALSAEAEDRLEQQQLHLEELKRMDANLGVKEQAAIDELAAEIARKRQQSSGGGSSLPIATPADITRAAGFSVHTSIASNVENMVNAAAADGVNLGGWGWRSSASQIALRKKNCGTSNYAIYQMSSSRCSPPTARPGASMHERGLAIDFTYNGGSISSRSSPGYKWLAAHAASYGFYNLPSEPWHWSTNGR